MALFCQTHRLNIVFRSKHMLINIMLLQPRQMVAWDYISWKFPMIMAFWTQFLFKVHNKCGITIIQTDICKDKYYHIQKN